VFVGTPTRKPSARATPAAAQTGESGAAAGATPVASATPRTYTVAKGDTVRKIAQKFHVTQQELLAANPTVKNANAIGIGDVLRVPAPAGQTQQP
jgi:LysM repeat protein